MFKEFRNNKLFIIEVAILLISLGMLIYFIFFKEPSSSIVLDKLSLSDTSNVTNYRNNIKLANINVNEEDTILKPRYTDVTEKFTESSFYVCGKIDKVDDDYIYFSTKDNGYYSIDKNAKVNFIDGRTLNDIDVSAIKENYYIDFSINHKIFIFKNISGDELKKDLLMNLADETNPNRNCQPWIELENIDLTTRTEAIVTIKLYDFVTEDFGTENNFVEIAVKFDKNTKFYSKGNNINSINDLETAKYNINTLYLDKSTINDDFPVVTKFESTDN